MKIDSKVDSKIDSKIDTKTSLDSTTVYWHQNIVAKFVRIVGVKEPNTAYLTKDGKKIENL